jgi:hypothetical protein
MRTPPKRVRLSSGPICGERRARPHMPVDKEAPLAEFEQIAPAFPVFRLASS